VRQEVEESGKRGKRDGKWKKMKSGGSGTGSGREWKAGEEGREVEENGRQGEWDGKWKRVESGGRETGSGRERKVGAVGREVEESGKRGEWDGKREGMEGDKENARTVSGRTGKKMGGNRAGDMIYLGKQPEKGRSLGGAYGIQILHTAGGA